MTLLSRIEQHANDLLLTSIDLHLCRYNDQMLPADDASTRDLIMLLCLILHRAQKTGHDTLPLDHVCAQLACLQHTLFHDVTQDALNSLDITPDELIQRCQDHSWVTFTDALNVPVNRPIVLSHTYGIVCFQRQLLTQRRIQEQLTARITTPTALSDKHLKTLQQHTQLDDDQRRACEHALSHSFSVITGGPGSGKTNTVFSIIDALLADSGSLSIALAASTGKAAARLTQSIHAQIDTVSGEQQSYLRHAKCYSKTLHRLLGYSTKQQRFIHDQHNPLTCDVLIVDEISMMSSELFSATLNALKPNCKIICLGDHNQLPAVDHGNVIEALQQSEHRDCITHLSKQYRFPVQSDIAQLLSGLNQLDQSSSLTKLLLNANDGSLHFTPLALNPDTTLQRIVERYHQERVWLLDDAVDPLEKIQRFHEFQVLTPFREGEFGVHQLNRAVETSLCGGSQYDGSQYNVTERRAFVGQRIIIKENHYDLGLFNGDMGLILADDKNDHLNAHFIHRDASSTRTASQANTLCIPVTHLPEYESAYAMTVHKSQGSEFNTLWFVIPPTNSDNQRNLLERKLIYTGVSRARQHCELIGDLNELNDALTSTDQPLYLLSYPLI